MATTNNSFEDYMNSSFGGYPYNGGGNPAPSGPSVPKSFQPMFNLFGFQPKPQSGQGQGLNGIKGAPVRSSAPVSTPGAAASPGGPSPFQLVQSTSSNAPGLGDSFGASGVGAGTAEKASDTTALGSAASDFNSAAAKSFAGLTNPTPQSANPPAPSNNPKPAPVPSTLGSGSMERSGGFGGIRPPVRFGSQRAS